MAEQADDILSKRDTEAWLRRWLPGSKLRGSGPERSFPCPAPTHKDKGFSASVNLDKRVWCCHARQCQRDTTGALVGIYMHAKRIDRVADAYRRLRKEEA